MERIRISHSRGANSPLWETWILRLWQVRTKAWCSVVDRLEQQCWCLEVLKTASPFGPFASAAEHLNCSLVVCGILAVLSSRSKVSKPFRRTCGGSLLRRDQLWFQRLRKLRSWSAAVLQVRCAAVLHRETMSYGAKHFVCSFFRMYAQCASLLKGSQEGSNWENTDV